MVHGKFRYGDWQAVGAAFGEQGRLLPEGLSYVSGIVDQERGEFWQVMESIDITPVERVESWMALWKDLIDFDEVRPVVPAESFWRSAGVVSPEPEDPETKQSFGATSAKEKPAGWTCTKCSEVIPEDFDICWACGTDRAGKEDPTFQPVVGFRPVCEGCGYLLIGLSGFRCPECGQVFDRNRKDVLR